MNVLIKVVKIIISSPIKLVFAAIIFSSILFSQQISNVKFQAFDDRIEIYYDLSGDPDESYQTSLTLRREEYAGFRFIPKNVSGDIGEGKFVGEQRKIIWLVQKDYIIDPEVTDYYFEIQVSPVSGGMAWYYYAGAAVIGGGAAVYYLLSPKENETTTARTPVAAPPGRP